MKANEAWYENEVTKNIGCNSYSSGSAQPVVENLLFGSQATTTICMFSFSGKASSATT